MNDSIVDKSHRAGRYQRQPGPPGQPDYWAFIPKPLPPIPEVERNDEFQSLLSEANVALGRLDGSIRTLPNPDLFVYMYMRKEAVLSSQIEGTQSSLQNLLAAEAKVLAPERPHEDVGEVINYVSAMRYGLKRLKSLPVSVQLIREIHKRLMHDVRGGDQKPGELRQEQNWIGPKDSTPFLGAIFIPPPDNIVLSTLRDLENFLHQEDQLPVLLKIGLAHAQFETIHPFLDGNGRVGRLLITFLLMKHRILHKPVLYLSHFLTRHKQEYDRRLQAIRDEGDWEGWLTFFFQGVAEVSKEATQTSARILLLREQHRDSIVKHLGQAAGNGIKLLERLFTNPIISVHNVMEWTTTAYPTSNNLVARLVELGILYEITGRTRNRIFHYAPYIALFSDEAPQERKA